MFKPVLYKEKTAIALPRKFLGDKEYADALEAFVLVCTDCILINQKCKTFYLAKRKSKPMSDWWFIGGRSFAGEDELSSIHRCLKRETGLDINPERFRFITMKRYLFKDRQQEPQDKSCDSLCYIFAVFVTDKEIAMANANLDSEEYDTEIGFKEFGTEELANEGVFPAIIDLYEYVFPDSTVIRPAQIYEEQWIVLHSVYKTFECSMVQLLGKPEILERKLIDRIPDRKKFQVCKLLNKGTVELEDVKSWSKLSIILRAILFMCREDSLGFHITHYYTVFPDGTVEHQSMINPNKHEERRPVKWRERREFFKTFCITPDEHWQSKPVPLRGID